MAAAKTRHLNRMKNMSKARNLIQKSDSHDDLVINIKLNLLEFTLTALPLSQYAFFTA